jgi:hypothetical protein
MSLTGGSSYTNGLAIGATSGKLFWKGQQVATTDMIPTLSGGTASANDKKVVTGVTVSGHAVTVVKKTLTAGANISITDKDAKITITASDLSALGGISSVSFAGTALTKSGTTASITKAAAQSALGLGSAAYLADGNVTPKAHTHTWS